MQEALQDLSKAKTETSKKKTHLLYSQSVVVASTGDGNTAPELRLHRLVDIKHATVLKSAFALCTVPFDDLQPPEFHVYTTKTGKDASFIVDFINQKKADGEKSVRYSVCNGLGLGLGLGCVVPRFDFIAACWYM